MISSDLTDSEEFTHFIVFYFWNDLACTPQATALVNQLATVCSINRALSRSETSVNSSREPSYWNSVYY